jgi:hypothetical protein
LESIAPNSTLNWHKLSSDEYWTIKMTGAEVKGEPIQPSSNLAIIDSGTSFLLMPRGINEF